MQLYDLVKEFQERQGYPVEVGLDHKCDFEGRQALEAVSTPLQILEDETRRAANLDLRAARVHLILEETRELVEALLCQDRVATADALTDLLYVVVGSFVTWDMPMDRLFDEVHRSNMSKQASGAHKPAKTGAYSPPDITGVLG